ncbi:MAG: polyamine aminopropyltransferase [Nitrospirae bacterium]|nr:polyamine aminopropyltransferase [Nitrospirota bacterium]
MIRFFEKDPYAPIQYTYEVSKVLYHKRSRFQDIMVFENPHFGRVLVLDGVVQITQRDEFFYHEMLTHVVMNSHPDPKNVIVIGGGDGGTVREVLKHKSVEKVYFIEIDEEVINVSKTYFPRVASGVSDKRVEIKCMDGAEFVKNRKSDIDLVIVDSTDIIGFAKSLFTRKFFHSIRNCLTPDGMYVSLSESLHFHKDIVIDVQKTLRTVFPVVDLYTAPLATYAGNWWTFSVGSKRFDPREIRSKQTVRCRYYSDEIHANAFLPLPMYRKLMSGKLDW